MAINTIERSGFKYFSNNIDSDTAIIFMHGVPFNAQLWLPVLELVSEHSCYAIDLKGFGFGASSYDLAPNDYNLIEQLNWLKQTIATISADKYIFVMHGWSAVPGTMLAQTIADKIVGLAYFEAQLRAVTAPDMLSLPMQTIAKSLLDQKDLAEWVMQENGYPELFLKLASISDLQLLQDKFGEQYTEPACRAAILQYLYEIPLGFQHSKIIEAINMNGAFLERADINKCLLYATPGLMTTMSTVQWAKDNLADLTMVDLGHALHSAPMTIPHEFAKSLNSWLTKVNV